MSIVTICGAGLVISCVAACAGGPRGINWQAAEDISGAEGGAAPVFAVNAEAITLGWVSAPQHGTDGRLFVRPDIRQPNAVEVEDALGSLTIYGETPPKLAYSRDGTLYAAYLVSRVVPGQHWPQSALRFTSSADDGHHWAAPLTVAVTDTTNPFGSTDDHALDVASDGTIYLTWLASAHDVYHAYTASSRDGGHTWSPPVAIDSGAACPCCRTAIASAPNGVVYAAWRKRYLGPSPTDEVRDIVVARSSDYGRTWGPPARAHVDDWHVNYCPDAGPSLRVGPDGTVHIAWWTGHPGRAGVQYAQSTDHGASFSAPVALGVGAFSRPAHVQLAIGSGPSGPVVLAIWDDGTRQAPVIVARLSRDGGRTFGERQALSAPGASIGYPTAVLHHDTAFVAWQERPDADARKDSIATAAKDPKNAATYVKSVGALRVVTRIGIL